MTRPLLPPAYELVVVEDGRDVALSALAAAGEAADGTVFWNERSDRLDMALLLEPEAPAAETALVHPVMALAVAEALGALLPPLVPVSFAFPQTFLLDGARLGCLRLRMAPAAVGAVPAWCLLDLVIDIAPAANEPGQEPWRTCLADAGAGGLPAASLLEGVCRHFLAWMHRWGEDGFAPVAEALNARNGAAATPAGRGRLTTRGGLLQDGCEHSLHLLLLDEGAV
ncbi:biotin/lipoate--protein ligase family protein [Geminicoccaceae bacterium 1502E]|nr:biotin/lipoate--protein ligase family protein [Geminicoccaceae bacterium 1502E]